MLDAASAPREETRPRSHLRVATTLFGLATGLGVLFGLQMTADGAFGGGRVNVGANIFRGVTIWWLWAAFAPLMMRIARRIHARPRPWLVVALGHLVAASAFSLLHDAIYVPLIIQIAWPELLTQLRSIWIGNVVRNTYGDLFTYGVIVGAWSAFEYGQRLRRKQEEAARLSVSAAELERALTQAQLETLRMQLNPHFLFNALNSVSTLMHRGDTNGATHALAQIGELLRTTLAARTIEHVPLRDEIDIVERYLAIERIRFGDRVRVEYHVDAAIEDAGVPVFILQPMIENALTHGVGMRPDGGTLVIRAEARGDQLVLSVCDDGPGPLPEPSSSSGIGLANTRARLDRLFGAAASLSVNPASGGGTMAVLALPRVAT